MISPAELVEQLPGVAIDRDSLPYFEGLLNHTLLINRCSACRHWHHPPGPVCPRCWTGSIEPTEPSGVGTIQALVRLRPDVDGATRTLIVVELPEQPALRVTATLAPGSAAEIGDRVRLFWDETRHPYPCFRPFDGPDTE
jgi:uncharacterized OB-fold protein